MGRILILGGLGGVALASLWYFWFAYVNRRKGAQALHWMQSACAGEGRILDTRWFGSSQVQLHLQFAAHWFENVRVTVQLLPRPLPVNWLISKWRHQKETLTFEADLGETPGFHLQVFQYRWLTQKHGKITATDRDWELARPGPVVLTTRTHWTQELTPVVNTLMTSRGHNLLSLHFRHESPHFAATVPLECLADEETAASFLHVLRELATGASTSMQ